MNSPEGYTGRPFRRESDRAVLLRRPIGGCPCGHGPSKRVAVVAAGNLALAVLAATRPVSSCVHLLLHASGSVGNQHVARLRRLWADRTCTPAVLTSPRSADAGGLVSYAARTRPTRNGDRRTRVTERGARRLHPNQSTNWAHGLVTRDPQIENIIRSVLTRLRWCCHRVHLDWAWCSSEVC
jgi:hypothetical protein